MYAPNASGWGRCKAVPSPDLSMGRDDRDTAGRPHRERPKMMVGVSAGTFFGYKNEKDRVKDY